MKYYKLISHIACLFLISVTFASGLDVKEFEDFLRPSEFVIICKKTPNAKPHIEQRIHESEGTDTDKFIKLEDIGEGKYLIVYFKYAVELENNGKTTMTQSVFQYKIENKNGKDVIVWLWKGKSLTVSVESISEFFKRQPPASQH